MALTVMVTILPLTPLFYYKPGVTGVVLAFIIIAVVLVSSNRCPYLLHQLYLFLLLRFLNAEMDVFFYAEMDLTC